MKYRRVKVETDVVENGQLLLLEESPYSYESENLPFYENPETDEQRGITMKIRKQAGTLDANHNRCRQSYRSRAKEEEVLSFGG